MEIAENLQASSAASVASVSRCALCGRDFRLAFPGVADPNTGEVFAIHRCTACELAKTLPEPADLAPYYEERYYRGRHWITRRYCAWRRTRVIGLSRRGRRAGGVMVDVGCGDGSFLLEARKAGWRVVGTEVSARIPAPGLEIWGSIDDLAPQAPFDCVTLWHSLEHLRDPVEGLRAIRRLLKRDGTLIVAVPNAWGMQARLFGRHWFHLDVPRHLHHFGVRSLRNTLDASGFRATRMWHHELEYDIFGWIQSALNAVLREPNVLFDWLTRRERRVSRPRIALHVVFGAALFAPAFLMTVLSTLMRSGGTIIAACEPRD